MDTTNIFVERNFSNGSSPAIQQSNILMLKKFSVKAAWLPVFSDRL